MFELTAAVEDWYIEAMQEANCAEPSSKRAAAMFALIRATEDYRRTAAQVADDARPTPAAREAARMVRAAASRLYRLTARH